MKEATITSDFVLALAKEMPGSHTFKHFDLATSGVPDLSHTWGGRTAWLELKFSTPGVEAEVQPMQVINMPRLAKAGLALWVHFRILPDDEQTRVIQFIDGSADLRATVHSHVIRGFKYHDGAKYVRRRIEEMNERIRLGVRPNVRNP